MEGWSALLSPPECQFYYAEDWGSSNNVANNNNSNPNNVSGNSGSNGSGNGPSDLNNMLHSDHVASGGPPHHHQPPLLQDIISQANLGLGSMPNGSTASSHFGNGNMHSSPGEHCMPPYLGNMLGGMSRNMHPAHHHSNQRHNGTPATAMTKVAVGIPIQDNGNSGNSNMNMPPFPGAPSMQNKGDCCGCGMGAFGCASGGAFCFPHNTLPPLSKNQSLFGGDPLSLEGVIDNGHGKGSGGPPLEGISMNNNCFSGLFIPLAMQSMPVGKDSPIMAKTVEGEWGMRGGGEPYPMQTQEGMFSLPHNSSMMLPPLHSHPPPYALMQQPRQQPKSRGKLKMSDGLGSMDSPENRNNTYRKRKRSAGLDELTFEGFFQSDKVLFQRYIRRWRNERNLVFYDCACGRRKAVHDLKKIKTHVEKIHSNCDLLTSLPPTPPPISMSHSQSPIENNGLLTHCLPLPPVSVNVPINLPSPPSPDVIPPPMPIPHAPEVVSTELDQVHESENRQSLIEEAQSPISQAPMDMLLHGTAEEVLSPSSHSEGHLAGVGNVNT